MTSTETAIARRVPRPRVSVAQNIAAGGTRPRKASHVGRGVMLTGSQGAAMPAAA